MMIQDQETFRFTINQEDMATGEIYQASRHKWIYDLYIVNGIEYQRERVAELIEKGDWVVV